MALQGDEPDLQLGSTGEHVVQLQDRLRGLGVHHDQPNGTFDDATEQALRDAQAQFGADTSGRMDTQVWEQMDQYMLAYGLEYNPYAGPGSQLWDQPGFGQQQDQWDAQAAAEEAPVIPHPDNIHPNIAGDVRFAGFNDFLREQHGVQ